MHINGARRNGLLYSRVSPRVFSHAMVFCSMLLVLKLHKIPRRMIIIFNFKQEWDLQLIFFYYRCNNFILTYTDM